MPLTIHSTKPVPQDVHSSPRAAGETAYTVIKGKTISKSAQSTIKNLAYTLSTPFRALVRQIVQNRAGERASSAGMINIKSAAVPARTVGERISQSGVSYEVVGVSEGTKRPSSSWINWA